MTYRTPLVAVLLATVLALLGPASAAAQVVEERILSFDQDIGVEADGTLVVRERIAVRAAGDRIRRGIFRDFLTTRGGAARQRYQFLEVRRNGQPEPFFTESVSGGVRLYIGEAERQVPPGRHVYSILYRVAGLIAFEPDQDLLFWNVTGQDWAFPIDRASVVVDLPRGVGFTSAAAFVGQTGSRGQDFDFTRVDDGRLRFETLRVLRPGEGLTVRVTWPAGGVDRAGIDPDRVLAAAARPVVIGFATWLIILVYLTIVWWRVGRAPKAAEIGFRMEPPDGLSPAAARFLMLREPDSKGLTAALLSIAVQGGARIEDDEGAFRVDRGEAARSTLSRGERAVHKALFPSGRDQVSLDREGRVALMDARIALRRALSGEYDAVFFRRNRWMVIPAIVAAAIGMFLMGFLSPGPDTAGLTVFALAWLGMGAFFGVKLTRMGRARGWKRAIAPLILVTVIVGGATIIMLVTMAPFVTPLGALCVPLVAATLLGFWRVLRSRTVRGQAMMDQLRAYQRFLAAARDGRSSHVTPDVYERHLPYAVALDMAEAWNGALDAALDDPAARTTGSDFQPRWYHAQGPHGFLARDNRDLEGLTNGLTGAVESATAPSPGSSGGGFGGGGGAGGGGGGGGGGGW